MKPSTDWLRAFALIGAQTQLAELERQAKEVRLYIAALSKKNAVEYSPVARKQYSEALKNRAIKLANEQGVVEAAKTLKIKPGRLYAWIRKTNRVSRLESRKKKRT